MCIRLTKKSEGGGGGPLGGDSSVTLNFEVLGVPGGNRVGEWIPVAIHSFTPSCSTQICSIENLHVFAARFLTCLLFLNLPAADVRGTESLM